MSLPALLTALSLPTTRMLEIFQKPPQHALTIEMLLGIHPCRPAHARRNATRPSPRPTVVPGRALSQSPGLDPEEPGTHGGIPDKWGGKATVRIVAELESLQGV